MVMNDDNTNTDNQGNQSLGQASTMLGMPAMGASEKGNPVNMENIPRQELDDHAMIVALQKEMNVMKQKGT